MARFDPSPNCSRESQFLSIARRPNNPPFWNAGTAQRAGRLMRRAASALPLQIAAVARLPSQSRGQPPDKDTEPNESERNADGQQHHRNA